MVICPIPLIRHHRAEVEIFVDHEQLLARDRGHTYYWAQYGWRHCCELGTEPLRAMTLTLHPSEGELFGHRAVGVSDLQFVAGLDPLARLLADQNGVWVFGKVGSLLRFTVEQYHRAIVEFLTVYEEFLALD